MAKIRIEILEDGNHYVYFCKGFGYEHSFGNRHRFNGNVDRPTVSPSLSLDFIPGWKCHSYIKDGMIEYLGDCWHGLKGKTIELPDI